MFYLSTLSDTLSYKVIKVYDLLDVIFFFCVPFFIFAYVPSFLRFLPRRRFRSLKQSRVLCVRRKRHNIFNTSRMKKAALKALKIKLLSLMAHSFPSVGIKDYNGDVHI